MVQKAIPDRLKCRDRVVVWRAGCSSGEEAYSLLFLTAERGAGNGEGVLDKLVVFGTDLDEAALEIPTRRSWVGFFEPLGGGLHRVREEYRKRVFFLADNLAGAQSPFLPASIDVCLCRNVLYYMTPEGRGKVLRKLARFLAPGGYLLLGETEVVGDHPEVGLRVANSEGVFVLKKGG